MAKGNVIFVTKVYHFLGFEGNSIIIDEFLWASKSRKDVVLKEWNDDKICSFSRRDGFYPLGKVISSCQNPFMLGWGRWVNFTNEVQTPLLKWNFCGNLTETFKISVIFSTWQIKHILCTELSYISWETELCLKKEP